MGISEGKNWYSGLLGAFSIIGVLAQVILCSENYALAQITPDGTLSDNSSRITPNVNIKGRVADRIDGGAIRGINLFHSFQDFNIGESQRVYFANPVGIENILTRVTGSNISQILGKLGVDGSANLFLLNPNGIVFGENARLDVGSSFVGSTANAIGSGIMSLIHSYCAWVRLLGYALLMLLSRCCLYIYSQLIPRELFYNLTDFSNTL